MPAMGGENVVDQRLSLVECNSTDQRTVAYVERLFRQTGVLKALNRAKWMT